jgi:hypothetical protein
VVVCAKGKTTLCNKQTQVLCGSRTFTGKDEFSDRDPKWAQVTQ